MVVPLKYGAAASVEALSNRKFIISLVDTEASFRQTAAADRSLSWCYQYHYGGVGWSFRGMRGCRHAHNQQYRSDWRIGYRARAIRNIAPRHSVLVGTDCSDKHSRACGS